MARVDMTLALGGRVTAEQWSELCDWIAAEDVDGDDTDWREALTGEPGTIYIMESYRPEDLLAKLREYSVAYELRADGDDEGSETVEFWRVGMEGPTIVITEGGKPTVLVEDVRKLLPPVEQWNDENHAYAALVEIEKLLDKHTIPTLPPFEIGEAEDDSHPFGEIVPDEWCQEHICRKPCPFCTGGA